MSLHESTFEYLKPTDEQIRQMEKIRTGFRQFVKFLDDELPDGPDKTYLIRKMRECAMWANVSITRESDGSPRQ
jgi:hypothetical protein